MSRSTRLLGIIIGFVALALTSWLPTGRSEQAKAPPAKAAKAASRASQICTSLARPISTEHEIPQGTPLVEALDFVKGNAAVTFLVNSDAFKNDLQIGEPESQPVRLPKLTQIRLDTALRLLLRQANAAYLVRADHIEITTPQRVAAEVWGTINPDAANPANTEGISVRQRPMLQLVNQVFEKTPLDEALRELSESNGVSIVADERRAGENLKFPVTGTLLNVPLDTAVRLLANQAELEVALFDNTLTVTTAENALTLQEQQEKLNRMGLEPAPAKNGPAQ